MVSSKAIINKKIFQRKFLIPTLLENKRMTKQKGQQYRINESKKFYIDLKYIFCSKIYY